MTLHRKFAGVLTFLTVVLASAAVRADIVISNYPPANDDLASTIATSGVAFSKAAGFTMPAGIPYTLDSVTLRLAISDLGATTTLSLFGDAGGNPGGPALLTFTTPAFGSLGIADYTFTPTASFTLLPSMTYWIAATGTSPTMNGILWVASNPGITPTGIATSAGYRFNNTGVFPPTGSSFIFNTYRVKATATAIPEPGTVTLLVIGLAGLTVYVVRKRRQG